MKCQFMLKKPEQKLIRVFLEYDNAKIQNVRITGDFFIYPEESIESIERCLRGVAISNEAIAAEIRKAAGESIQFFGITPESIAEAIVGCVK